MVNSEHEGVVSVWVFRERENPYDTRKDVLRDLCGVDYYDIDAQEGATSKDPGPLASLLIQLSYSNSFIGDALNAAERMGIREAFGVIVQFDR
jgi:hypothetical protein